MLVDHGLRNGKSQTGSFSTSCHHGIKNLFLHIGGNPRSVVDNVDSYHQLVKIVANRELALRPTAQDNRVGAALSGIANQVQDRLDQQFRIR